MPGPARVLTQLFGSGRKLPVDAPASEAGLALGRVVQLGVAPDAADGDRVLGQPLEQAAVGQPPVAQDPQLALGVERLRSRSMRWAARRLMLAFSAARR